VVLLKALQERRLLETERGKVAVGWLIVEDLAMVLVLVLIPAATGIASGEHGNLDPLSAFIGNLFHLSNMVGVIIGVTLFKVVLFVLLMLVVGRKLIPWILHRIAHSGSRELFRLGVLAIALGVAFGAAKLFGVSLALGAFFAGMVLSESPLSHRAAQESLPLRDAFAVLFFVSVGMLFDPGIIFESPLPLLATVVIIVLGKSLAALLIVLAFRRTAGTALTIAASLAQIGEFSFILAGIGNELHLLPQEGTNLILGGAIISIILNPLVFWICDRLKPMLEARLAHPAPAPAAPSAPPEPQVKSETEIVAGAEISAPQPDAKAAQASTSEPATADTKDQDDEEPHATTATGHTILVGYGRVGHIVGEALKAAGHSLVVIEDAAPQIRQAQAQGIEVIPGNAASADILALANLAEASTIVVAIPESFEAGQVVTKARNANPTIQIIGRAHSDAEVDHLTGLGATTVIMGEREIARGMLEELIHPPEKPEMPEIANTIESP
jgi:monovalent cation:H+ antiporter-2, CPA2 family